MSKEELIDKAQSLGIDTSNLTSKKDLQNAIDNVESKERIEQVKNLRYIGPEYRKGIVINGRLMKPQSWTDDHARTMINQVPGLKKYFSQEN